MESEGRRLHGLAAQARERGESVEAVKLAEDAMAAYQKDRDALGFAEALADQFLSLRHLFDKTGDRNYLIRAKHSAMASVEVAESSGDKSALPIPYFNLAKAQETLGQLQEAVTSYKKAVELIISNPPAAHKVPERPAIVADFKVHLATCEYKQSFSTNKAGDKSALERAEAALSDLEANPDISDYNQHVWVSGGHMRIAEMLREDDPEKAKKHLQKAKEVIDSDPKLTIRLSQWQQLAEKFK